MFKSLICAMLGHKINRRRVHYDGLEFHTNCRRCHTPMVRLPSGWQVRDDGRDTHSDRHLST